MLQSVSKDKEKLRNAYGLMGRTMAVHERYKSLYFLSRPLQNNNVKLLKKNG